MCRKVAMKSSHCGMNTPLLIMNWWLPWNDYSRKKTQPLYKDAGIQRGLTPLSFGILRHHLVMSCWKIQMSPVFTGSSIPVDLAQDTNVFIVILSLEPKPQPFLISLIVSLLVLSVIALLKIITFLDLPPFLQYLMFTLHTIV